MFTFIAIILSTMIFYISAAKDYLGKINTIIQEMDNIKKTIYKNKEGLTDEITFIEKLNNINIKMDEIQAIYTMENYFFLSLAAIIIIGCVLFIYNFSSTHSKHSICTKVELVLRQK
ncbi:hypothetical protein [Lysinibacillus sp. NPDC056232]|uniref:hypothetical protein n=1 Tax=Lysinibacillus sp. NPDC056232 TaxID=3345756 RepID=UPI0035DD72D7